ncbi:MAG: efflux RND transporter periplasmic adaptor subunit [Bacteroidetes bacterium]|jgi:membrane fusion protein, multidrug efflux system|nr:efflux RND transporter periplasmic adaptor subunit [Bacteroidota bacterium]MBT3751314.1 efflux RND transporter periplasmic adaptor subunit [Bacteroidota bacterium]MBT4400268.1 efflux RND transporter periplasmic adaptor subunit [Bacteroidota bacterium]MBT4411884.1 efflux RND transporter periplasmic adaptor subunit [Bacteroidota bacterium]MBT5427750.1 efflux RND transporter periplasmic adaptor subunit [Bacteroidota bacterium]
MKRNTLLKSFLIPFLALAILGGCRNEEADVEADVAVPVSILDIKYQPIEEFITTNGTVLATKEVELSAEAGGKYKLMNNPRTGRVWALGDIIKTGDVIVSIEDEEYVNNIQIKSKELNLEISKDQWGKIESLYEKGGETLSTLKNAEQTFINAEYTLANAKLQLAKMQVLAPFNGVIVDLPYITEGNKIQAGTPVVSLMDYLNLFMEIQLPEKNLASLSVNQNVRILNYTMPDDTLWGSISQMSPAINPDTRNFKGIITVKNPGLRLRPGSYVKAEIVTNSKDSTIVIPKDIIVSRQRGKSVFIVDQNTAYERSIKTGLENPDEVEVIGGLELNNRVVTEGFETLGNRSKVKIIR